MGELYDVVVVGSGIAGSTLALVLSRAGCRTLVVEKGRHPRFAIGESTVPTTTLAMRQLAERYGVPELADVCHYLGLKKHGLTAYPKRHFWFGLHHEGREMAPGEEIVLDTFPLPVGPDVHMLRSDADAFLVSRFARYGVEYTDRSEILQYGPQPGNNAIRLRTPQGERQVRARFVVDASGHSSYFARSFGLRESPPRFHTNTRTIFGHFRNVRNLDAACRNRHHPFRYQRDSGTLQHCFDGGWFWVIPFDDGVTSVGVMLDREEFPLDDSLTAEEELRAIVDRFPTVRAHLGRMTPVRPLVRTDRVQFSCCSILGNGFLLTPHAAAFVDPLFSTGMLLTMTFLCRLVPLLQQALAENDYSPERFEPLERAFFREVELIDLAVDGMIKSFRHFEIFRQFWRIWVQASGNQYFATALVPAEENPGFPAVYGAGLEEWRRTVTAMHRVVSEPNRPPLETARELKRLMDRVPQPFALSRYAMNTGRPLYIHTQMDTFRVLRWVLGFCRLPELTPRRRPRGFVPFLLDVFGVGLGQARLAGQYVASRWKKTPLHRWVDGILAMNAGSGRRLLTTLPAATLSTDVGPDAGRRLDEAQAPVTQPSRRQETLREPADAQVAGGAEVT